MIQPSKKSKILMARQARIKAVVGSSVIAEAATNGAGVVNHIVTGKNSGSTRGQKQSRKNSQQSCFARTVGTEERNSFPLAHFEGNSAKGRRGGGCEGLQEGAPAALRWRE
jgi:hypothetical protein